MNTDILTPDLGSDDAFPVVEILANIGDELQIDDPIVLLESDKATMEVPATAAGKLTEISVKVGDKIKTGDVVAKMAVSENAKVEKPAEQAKQPQQKQSPPESKTTTRETTKSAAAIPAVDISQIEADVHCEMLVLGSGPGGYSAAFRSADLGMDTVLVEKYDTLGGVCLNVGCIPSKALLHTAHVIEDAAAMAVHGVAFDKPKIDLDKVRAHKDKVVGRLTQGIAGMAKTRKVKVVQGYGKFASANTVIVEKEGKTQTIAFAKAIIACGSRVIKLPFMPDDPRVLDSTGALQLADVPEHLLVIGGGIIGMEMATVYSTLGAKITVVELSPSLMPGADADLVRTWTKANKHRFAEMLLETKVVAAEAVDEGIKVTFEGKSNESRIYDKVLMAVGRAPNGLLIDADKAGVAVGERGFIEVDSQMRTNVAHIFAIGDVVGQPMLAHKAVHEAHVAAEAAKGEKSHFDARVIPSVAYTFPEIAFVGLTENEAKAQGIAYATSVFPWAASGKAIANDADNGFVKLLFDPATDRLLGGGIVGLNAGDLIAEICLAVEMGADATDIGKTIHPHPTLGESVGMAAEALHGHCTDLPPKRARNSKPAK
ncbi:MAG: dihydrolipoyl dehydrogenase [Gammaproteobacteria bacterium]|nr:MAG: dihydrolipoyl dehydrogenase [Gammaproteobacteria bacterium]